MPEFPIVDLTSDDRERKITELSRVFQGFIDSTATAAERTVAFSIDGAAYYRVTPGQYAALVMLAPPDILAFNSPARLIDAGHGDSVTAILRIQAIPHEQDRAWREMVALGQEIQGDQPVTSDQAAAAYIERLTRHRHGRPPEWYFAAKVAGEAAEAQEAWMQLEGWSRHPGTLEHLAEELADTEISARALAQLYGIDLDAAITRKHQVLMARDLRAGSDPEGES